MDPVGSGSWISRRNYHLSNKKVDEHVLVFSALCFSNKFSSVKFQLSVSTEALFSVSEGFKTGAIMIRIVFHERKVRVTPPGSREYQS